MRIHRGYLFWGIFFLLLGGIPLADRAGLIDVSALGEVWRLWPLAIIAVGLAILVSRTQVAMVGTILAALVFGALAGGLLAYGGGWVMNVGDCGDGGAALEHTSQNGSFSGDATVELHLNCGTLAVDTASGSDWNLDAGYRGDPPQISSGSDRLSVRAPDGPARRQEWDVTLGTDALRGIDVQTNAGSAELDLSGATLDRLDAELNAGELKLATGGGSIDDLRVSVNAGSAKLSLDGPVAGGQLSVNAGSIDVCVPDDAALQIELNEQFAFGHNLNDRGLSRDGDTWSRSGSGPAITFRVEGNAASFNLDPSGGCR